MILSLVWTNLFQIYDHILQENEFCQSFFSNKLEEIFYLIKQFI